MRNNYNGLNLVLKQMSGSIMRVTFTDPGPNTGLVSRIFNIAAGTLQIASTAGTYSAGVYSASVGIKPNFEGL